MDVFDPARQEKPQSDSSVAGAAVVCQNLCFGSWIGRVSRLSLPSRRDPDAKGSRVAAVCKDAANHEQTRQSTIHLLRRLNNVDASKDGLE